MMLCVGCSLRENLGLTASRESLQACRMRQIYRPYRYFKKPVRGGARDLSNQ